MKTKLLFVYKTFYKINDRSLLYLDQLRLLKRRLISMPRVILVGPFVNYISGSVLRPLNIWYSLRDIRHIVVKYIPVKKLSQILLYINDLITSDIVIISGVNPWVMAFIALLRKIFRKLTIVDVHGFAWYEAFMSKCGDTVYRTILLISELIAYRNATHIIVASRWLTKVLRYYLGINHTFVLQNATTTLFEKFAKRLRQYDIGLLRKFVYSKILGIKQGKEYLLVAPLPKVSLSNILAHKTLLRLVNELPQDIIIIVCLLYTSPSPRDLSTSRMPSSA